VDNQTNHSFTFYLLTAYAPAVAAPLALMAHDGHSFTANPGLVISFAVLYGALIGVADHELLAPARESTKPGSMLGRLFAAFALCALAGSGLYAILSAFAAG
jgi:hypothetical protein